MPQLFNKIVGDTPEQQAKIDEIMRRGEEERRQIARENLLDNARIAGGALLSGASALPFFNIPYVGTGIGGAMEGAGQAIMQGKSGKDIASDAGIGFAIGETVGAIPYAGKFAGKTKAGQAVINKANGLYDKIMATDAGRKFGDFARKAEDVLMTDIKAFNPNKQTVYHGSPYDFAKFSNEAIGTGEGAQAHGMGHYAAISKNLAEEYRTKLAPKTPEENLAIKIDDLQELKKLKNEQDIKGVSGRRTPINYDSMIKDLESEIKYLSSKYDIKNIKKNGQVYKLSIPKDDVMLREDLPLSQQPLKVQEAINKINRNLGISSYDDLNRQSIDISNQIRSQYNFDNINWQKVRELENLQDEITKKMLAANPSITGKKYYENIGKDSNLLNQHGIKGISYNGGIDGEARVIFNPDDIEIVRKYYNQPSLYEKIINALPNAGAVSSYILNN